MIYRFIETNNESAHKDGVSMHILTGIPIDQPTTKVIFRRAMLEHYNFEWVIKALQPAARLPGTYDLK